MPTIRLTRHVGQHKAGDLLTFPTPAACDWFVGRGFAEHHQSPPQKPESQRPPTAGPGSGRQAWADYATQLGHTTTPNMTRADIITLTDG